MKQEQIRERDLEIDPEQGSKRRFSGKMQIATVVVALIAIVTAIVLVFTGTIGQQKRAQQFANLSLSPASIARSTDLTTIVTQVLKDENEHGWNEQSHTMLINWRRDDLAQVNCGPDACEVRGNAARHDSQNDLRTLENIYWYKSLHPGDTSMDQYITRMLPWVKKEWSTTTAAKGWIYYELLRMRDFSNDASWDHTLQIWAQAQYKGIDPVLGLYHGPIDTSAGHDNVPLQDGYRVDLDLEMGLALVDAGARYQHPEWITAGKREVAVVIKQTYDHTYHLFNRVYLVHDSRFGNNKVWDTQARMGETGQEIEILLRAGSYTHTNEYLQLAKEMIDNLRNSPLRDTVHGGYYFKLYLGPYQGHKTGDVDKNFKEARQLHVLIGIDLANRIFNNRWADLEQDLIKVGTQLLYLPPTVPGFTYRVKLNGDLYPSPKSSPIRAENWNTAEADNIALKAFETVLNKH